MMVDNRLPFQQSLQWAYVWGFCVCMKMKKIDMNTKVTMLSSLVGMTRGYTGKG